MINKSDSYVEMKQWLILNYGDVSRIINDVISDLSHQPNLLQTTVNPRLRSTPVSAESCRDWKDCQRKMRSVQLI